YGDFSPHIGERYATRLSSKCLPSLVEMWPRREREANTAPICFSTFFAFLNCDESVATLVGPEVAASAANTAAVHLGQREIGMLLLASFTMCIKFFGEGADSRCLHRARLRKWKRVETSRVIVN